jgi:hypothetical protein
MTSLLFDDVEFLSPCADEILVITHMVDGRLQIEVAPQHEGALQMEVVLRWEDASHLEVEFSEFENPT